VRSFLRTHVAVWLLIPALVGVAAYYASFVDPQNYRGYWPAVASNSAIFLLFSCILASSSSAIEMSRLQRSGILDLPSTRTRLLVTLDRLWPSLVLAFLVQLLAFAMLSLGTWGVPGFTPIILWSSFVSVIAMHVALGAVLGRYLPMAAAVPLSLVASYSWLGFTWSVPFFPLRYLSGLEVVTCCRLDMQLDPLGPFVTVVFSLSLACILLALSVLRWRGRNAGGITTRVAFLALTTVAATSLCLFIARDLGAAPVMPRSQNEASCTETNPSVCLFPEQHGKRDPSQLIIKASDNLTRAGIEVPSTVRFSINASTSSTLNMAARPYMKPEEVLHSFTSAFLSPQLASYCGDADEHQSRLLVASVIQGWLLDRASVDIIEDPVSDPPTRVGIEQVEQLSPDGQALWVSTNLPRLTDCSISVLELPPS